MTLVVGRGEGRAGVCVEEVERVGQEVGVGEVEELNGAIFLKLRWNGRADAPFVALEKVDDKLLENNRGLLWSSLVRIVHVALLNAISLPPTTSFTTLCSTACFGLNPCHAYFSWTVIASAAILSSVTSLNLNVTESDLERFEQQH